MTRKLTMKPIKKPVTKPATKPVMPLSLALAAIFLLAACAGGAPAPEGRQAAAAQAAQGTTAAPEAAASETSAPETSAQTASGAGAEQDAGAAAEQDAAAEPGAGATGADAAGADAAGSAGAAAKELFTLYTSTKKECTSTLYVVGEAKGIFEKHGIRLEYTGEINTPAEALTAVLNGTNNFEGSLPNAIATYVAEGAQIKAVTYLQVDPPESYDGIGDIARFRHMRFVVRADSPIQTISDLAGYTGTGTGGSITISGRAPSCNSFLPSAALRANGLDPSRLELVAFNGTTEILQALELGSLDIAGIHPPFYKLAADSGYRVVWDSHDTGLGQAAGAEAIYFPDDFIAEHPEEIQAFVSAMKECAQWTRANIDEAISLTAAYIGQDISAVHWYYGEPGFPAEFIQPWIDDLVLNGALEEGQITLEDIATTQFE